MSVETSRTSQPGDGDPADGRRFAFRSADSAAERDDDFDDDSDVVSRDADASRDDIVGRDADDEDSDDQGADDEGGTVEGGTGGWRAALGGDPQPTFTPVVGSPLVSSPEPVEPTLNETDEVPVVPTEATGPVTPPPPLAETAIMDASQPLLGDAVGLRASWQQAQAGFVDDPRAAVADAAELVEHTAQTLIGSLQQRQRQLRTQWDNNGSGTAGPAAAGESSDTEQLRHLMQEYRSLFNQLCRP